MAGSEVANKYLSSVSRHLCAKPSKFGKFRWESKKINSSDWVVPALGTLVFYVIAYVIARLRKAESRSGGDRVRLDERLQTLK